MPAQTGARGEEPPMFLQRPSTGKSQDVRHILAKTFREIFTRDPVGIDTMKKVYPKVEMIPTMNVMLVIYLTHYSIGYF